MAWVAAVADDREGAEVKRCYCLGQTCGRDTLEDGTRTIHFDAAIDWGKDDLRDPWSGSYDFGSFACVALWAADRSSDHDGRVLTEGIDPAQVAVAEPPVGEITADVKT